MEAPATLPAEVQEVLEDWAAVQRRFAALPLETLDAAGVLHTLAARQQVTWADAATDHRLVNRLQELGPAELGGHTAAKAMVNRLRISGAEATQRVADADVLGPRRALTGEALQPVMPNVASGVSEGHIGPAHVGAIRDFFAALPPHLNLADRIKAEETAAQHAGALGVTQLRRALNHMLLLLDPDGCFNDREIRRRRGIVIGRQRPDGTASIRGELTPEALAIFQAVFAKLAAPGMCNPDDENPCVSGRPTDEQIKSDTRTVHQRNHDAWVAGGRMILASKKLGKLNGLPVTVVVTTTLRELESGAGFGVTGGGSLLPMRDLIRMASHAFHYLSIFDDHGQPLWLGRTKRIASPAQRLVLFGKERGCSAPGCTKCFYETQVHHAVADWGNGGRTNINELTLACGPDNRSVGPGGWTTRIRADGRCEWIPPPHLDNGGPRVNDSHHPERLLNPDQQDDEDAED